VAVNEALPFDEPEDDVAVARAEPAHGPQAVEDGPSMWMRAGRPDATRATEARPRAVSSDGLVSGGGDGDADHGRFRRAPMELPKEIVAWIKCESGDLC
jgi:hypothetical protein